MAFLISLVLNIAKPSKSTSLIFYFDTGPDSRLVVVSTMESRPEKAFSTTKTLRFMDT
jgi:hypothetical protein